MGVVTFRGRKVAVGIIYRDSQIKRTSRYNQHDRPYITKEETRYYEASKLRSATVLQCQGRDVNIYGETGDNPSENGVLNIWVKLKVTTYIEFYIIPCICQYSSFSYLAVIIIRNSTHGGEWYISHNGKGAKFKSLRSLIKGSLV